MDDVSPVPSTTAGRAAAERAALLLPRLVVLDAGGTKGRGVFALERITKGRVVERAPVLVFPSPEWDAHARHTLLAHYAFRWPPRSAPEPGEDVDKGAFALALGHGSLFNHSARPNVGWVRRAGDGVIEYVALEDVEAGKELLISYGARTFQWMEADAEAAAESLSSEGEGEDGGLGSIVVDGS
jgi:hypothetical protein